MLTLLNRNVTEIRSTNSYKRKMYLQKEQMIKALEALMSINDRKIPDNSRIARIGITLECPRRNNLFHLHYDGGGLHYIEGKDMDFSIIEKNF